MLVSYIDSVSKTNEEYKKIQTLSVTLNNVDTEIKENHDKIKTLTENNEALTLRVENLAKNISFKVKRTKRAVSLEPMNPYERRIIHSALQNDRYVTTHSEGDEPFRRVVVTLKR